MARTFDEVCADALQLSVEERGSLVDSLYDSFLTDEEREIQESWIAEAERRLADYDAGRTEGIPYEKVMKELRAKYGPKSRASRRS